jgi:hypothetical protein
VFRLIGYYHLNKNKKMGFFKNMAMRTMLKSQMKGVPADQQDKIMNAFEANPQLFENIAKEVQEKMKNGKGQMDATMEVMQKHQEELRKIM